MEKIFKHFFVYSLVVVALAVCLGYQNFFEAEEAEAQGVSLVEVRVAMSSDDAEEHATGVIDLTSSDLELVQEADTQQVGMRFQNIGIPGGASIANAYIQFQVDEVSSTATDLAFYAEDIDNAPVFTTTSGNISSRVKTSAFVNWSSVPAWPTVGEAGADQRTPNLSSIIQEVVDRPGWVSGSSIVVIVTGVGKRVAESYDGSPGGAPLLHIEFSDPLPDIDTGLVGYWNFDDGPGSGTATDSSGGGHTGTLVNMTPASDWVVSNPKGEDFGYALDFDGVNDYVSIIDNSTLEPPGDMTVSAWIKFHQLSSASGSGQKIVFKDHSVSPWVGYELFLDVSDQIIFDWVSDSSTYYTAGYYGTVEAGQWYHVVGVKEGGNLRFYFNGSADTTWTQVGVSGSLFNTNGPLCFGGDTGYDSLNGQIDEVRVYNRALSLTDVQALYAFPSNTPPVANATISTDGVTYSDLITVTQGVATSVYLAASSGAGVSTDPDGWTDATNGVSTSGFCEWNSDLNQGPPIYEQTINSPASATACNISLGSIVFNDPPGTYTYSVLRITDNPGAVSNVDTVQVTVVAQVVGFTDVTVFSGTGNAGGANGIAWEDYDNDGHLDLWVSGAGQLYRNNGNGTFSLSSECPAGGGGSVWVDADNNGHMDLLVSRGYFYDNNGDGTFTERALSANLIGDNLGTAVALDYNKDGYIDFFFPNGNTSPGNEIRENNGAGSFVTIDGGTIGLGAGEGNGEFSAGGDVNNDGNVDLYYAAPYNPAYALLYYSSGLGTFDEDASGAGLAVYMGTQQPYFAPVFGDYNNDGWLDLFLGHPSGYESRLYLNDGDGTFTRQGSAAPDTNLGHARGAAWGDYDNDGDLDLLIGVDGGPNRLFRNDGGGVFTDVSFELGIQNGTQPTKSVSFADYDNDGDLDIYYDNGGTANVLFRNDLNNNSYLKVKVVGAGSNFSPRDGIGTRVELWNSNGTTLLAVREVSGGEGFGNSPSKIQHFGLSDSWGGGNGTYVVKAKFSSGQIVTRTAVIPTSESITIGGTVLSQTIEIKEEANLTVSLSSNPSSGQAPLSGVDLTANVFGSETGTINYYFWCNCDSTGTNLEVVQTACGGPNLNVHATNINPYVASGLCSYSTSGTKTAKTIVERGSSQAEGRAEIEVYSYSSGGLWGHYLDSTDRLSAEYSKLYTEAVVEKIDFDNFDGTLAQPSRLGKPNGATIIWSGSIYAPTTGTYNFRVVATGDMFFQLDISRWDFTCDTGAEIQLYDHTYAPEFTIDHKTVPGVYLKRGWHPVRIESRVYTGASDSSLKLFWTPPGGAEDIVPASVLSPEAWSDKVIAIPDITKPKEKIDYVIGGTGGKTLDLDINSGLIGWWTLDNVEGNVLENSGGYCQYPGYTVNMDFPADLVPGKLGNALSFNGVNEYVSVSSTGYYSVTDGYGKTISAWFKAPAQVDNGYILWKDANCKGWNLQLKTDGKVAVTLRTENVLGAGCSDYSTHTITTTDANYANNVWHHALINIDRRTGVDRMELFIDGVSKGTVSLPDTQSSHGGTLRFATDWDGGEGSYEGLIDDVRIYDRVLNAEEIAALASANGNPTNPLNVVINLNEKGISLDDVIKDEVYMFAMRSSNEEGHRVKNKLTGAEEWITATRFVSSTGWPIGYIYSRLPESLFLGQADKTKIDFEFNLDDGQFRHNGIVLLIPYINSGATYTARLYIRTTGEGLYQKAGSVYVFPVDFSEELTTEDIRPFFVFGDGETLRKMPSGYRPNYMYYVSGDIAAGEYPPGEFEIIQNMPGAIRLIPKGSINVPAGSLVVMGASNGDSGSYLNEGWTSPLVERTDGPNPSSAVLATASGIELSAIINATYTATGSMVNSRSTGVVGVWPDSSTSVFQRAGGITGTSFSFDIGASGTNRLVVVAAADESSGINLGNVTVDGKSCNLVTRANNLNGVGNHQEMWYCDESDLGVSSGTVNVSIVGGNSGWAVHAHLYTGVSQDGPVDFGINNTSVNQATVNVSGIDSGPPDIDNPYSWYPAFGREGAQLDITSQNYAKNQAVGATTGGGNLSLFSIPEEDDWIAFQAYGLNFPRDNVVGAGESMTMFGGGLVSIESIGEVPLPGIPMGVNASSTLCATANISWNDGIYEDYYVIQRKSTLNPVFATTTTLAQNTTFFHDISLSNIEYTYRVRACNDDDTCSSFSSEVSVVPASCGPQPYFTLQSSGSVEINLSGNMDDITTSTETKITATSFFGFADDISLSVDPMTDPFFGTPGVVYNFSDNILSEAEYPVGSQFSVTLPGHIPPGVYAIIVRGDGGSYTAGVSVTLYVNSITPDWREI